MMDWFRTLDQSLKTRLKKFQIFLKPTALSSGKYVDLDFMYMMKEIHSGTAQHDKLGSENQLRKTLAESFYYVIYGSSIIITSKVQ